MGIRPLVAMALIALTANQVAAQDRPAATRSQLSVAAGYKAQFVCSGTFNAGKTIDAIRADELTGIYPEVEPLLAQVGPAKIDREEKRVTVDYADDLPPRAAVWREGVGCTALAAGSGPASAPASIQIGERAAAPAASKDAQITAKLLEPLSARAIAGEYGGKTSAVVIVRDSELMHEDYASGFTPRTSQRTWSVAKSIAATIVGAATYPANTPRGYAFETRSVTSLPMLSTASDPRKSITVDDLLRMASGLDTGGPGSRTDAIYFGSGAVSQHATKHALSHAPGTVFNYANNDTLLAMLALRESMASAGLDYHRFVRETLDRIGMRDTVPEADWQGNFILSSQVWSTARDLALMGQLYLDDGVVKGERILPEDWVRYATTPSGPQPPLRGEPGGCRLGYGAQFWLYNNCDGIPDGSFAALGNRGQFVVIVPARNAVIVRRGYDTASDRFDMVAFARETLEALGQ